MIAKFLRTSAAVILQLIIYVAAVLALGYSSIVAAISLNTPSLIVLVGLLAAALTVFLASCFPALLLKLRFKFRYVALQTIVTTLILFAIVGLLLFRPLAPKADYYSVAIPSGIELWDLHTGSSVAVRKISGKGTGKAQPIIFVHGGPGAYSVELEQTVKPISKLNNDGYDVYFYDQVGGGLSARLEDISAYSLSRHIVDLNAVIEKIGAEKVVLIGSSFGTTLVSNYIAKHPSNVSHAVFSAAAPIYHPRWGALGDGNLEGVMTLDQRKRFRKKIFKPRLLAAIGLAEVNPTAASKFLPPEEAGAFFDDIANEFYMSFTVCDSSVVRTRSAGYGFWSNRITGKTLWNRTNDPRPILRKNNLPVLIIRGECDYKKEAVAKEYAEIFPNSSYVSLENAGHMIYWEQPDAYLRAVRDFLKH